MGSCQRPVTSLDPKFWCYLIRGIGSLWGHCSSSLATGITVWSHSQIFFVLPMSGTYKLFNSALHHLSPQHTTSVIIFYQWARINQHYLLFKSCGLSLEYQFLSVQHEPKPISLRNQPVGHHRVYLISTITLRIQQIFIWRGHINQ